MQNALIPKKDGLPYKVLLAEDREVNQIMGVNLLQSLGFEVDLVKDGQQALSRIRQNKYDMVFMDCDMPIMDGYEATAAIREYEEREGDGRKTPIVALTAKVMQNDREKCINSGMDDYIPKPIRPDAIIDAVNKWCAKVIDYQSQW